METAGAIVVMESCGRLLEAKLRKGRLPIGRRIPSCPIYESAASSQALFQSGGALQGACCARLRYTNPDRSGG